MEIKLLSILNKEEKKLFSIKTFKKNSCVFSQGSYCSSVCILISGKIMIANNFEDGRNIVFRTLKSGGLFGNNLIFSSDPKYKGDVICAEESIIALFEKNDLLYLLQNNIEFLKEYMRIQADFGKELNGRVKILTSKNSIEKVSNFLELNGGSVFIKSVTKLADELNLSRENLSRTISLMIKKRMITRNGKYIKIIK